MTTIDMASLSVSEPELYRVDPPSSDEIDRATELAAGLSMAINRTPKGQQVQLGWNDAVELCQLLHDSLRTAKQLEQIH